MKLWLSRKIAYETGRLHLCIASIRSRFVAHAQTIPKPLVTVDGGVWARVWSSQTRTAHTDSLNESFCVCYLLCLFRAPSARCDLNQCSVTSTSSVGTLARFVIISRYIIESAPRKPTSPLWSGHHLRWLLDSRLASASGLCVCASTLLDQGHLAEICGSVT